MRIFVWVTSVVRLFNMVASHSCTANLYGALCTWVNINLFICFLLINEGNIMDFETREY